MGQADHGIFGAGRGRGLYRAGAALAHPNMALDETNSFPSGRIIGLDRFQLVFAGRSNAHPFCKFQDRCALNANRHVARLRAAAARGCFGRPILAMPAQRANKRPDFEIAQSHLANIASRGGFSNGP